MSSKLYKLYVNYICHCCLSTSRPAEMSSLVKVLVVLGLVGLVKTHKIIVLAALGLMGLWMAHILAQDYQNFTKPVVRHLLGKRSVHSPETNWDLILSNDPNDCFKSFLCQISVNPDNLSPEEQRIWNIASESAVLRQFTMINELVPENCMKKYFRCPFNKDVMSNLIQRLGTNKKET